MESSSCKFWGGVVCRPHAEGQPIQPLSSLALPPFLHSPWMPSLVMSSHPSQPGWVLLEQLRREPRL